MKELGEKALGLFLKFILILLMGLERLEIFVELCEGKGNGGHWD